MELTAPTDKKASWSLLTRLKRSEQVTKKRARKHPSAHGPQEATWLATGRLGTIGTVRIRKVSYKEWTLYKNLAQW